MAPLAPSRKSCINSLTGLRFVFILMIVFSHFEFLSVISTFYTQHLHNAGIAVAFFFMMSGFGLTYSSTTKKKNAMNGEKWNPIAGYFYAFKKMKKLYVAYLISMAMMIPLAIIGTLEHHGFYVALASCVGKFILGTTLLQSIAGVTKYSHIFNGACWFLSTLFILYIFYPLLERLNQKYLIGASRRIVILLISVFTARLLLFYGLHSLDVADLFFNDLSYGSPYLRITDFVIGILLCDLFFVKQDKKMNEKSLRKFTGIEIFSILTLLAWWVMRNAVSFNILFDVHLKNFIDVIIAAETIYVFAWQKGYVSKILASPIMLTFGNSAMFIYLFHYPIRMNIGRITGYSGMSLICAAIVNIAVILSLTTLLTMIFMKVKNRRPDC